jgi:hypothetical protein
MLTTAIDLKGTANTVLNTTVSTNLPTINLITGDRLALKDTGVLTSLSGVCLMITLSF